MDALAVTFDFGQTLADLDTALLSARLAERGVAVSPDALEAAAAPAWRAYDRALDPAAPGHPWKRFMRELLSAAGRADAPLDALIDWLWTEQPRRNLWRRPVPGMLELVRGLRARGVKLGVISNSEGKVAELAGELGIRDQFDAIADSRLVGFEKPSPRIFSWAAERLGTAPERIIHVGDSWAADVQGALAAGLQPIWFRGDPARALQTGVTVCLDAAQVAAALRLRGLPAIDIQS